MTSKNFKASKKQTTSKYCNYCNYCQCKSLLIDPIWQARYTLQDYPPHHSSSVLHSSRWVTRSLHLEYPQTLTAKAIKTAKTTKAIKAIQTS